MISPNDTAINSDHTDPLTIPPFRCLVLYTGNLMQTGTALTNTTFQKSNLELIQALKDTIHMTVNISRSLHYDPATDQLEIPDIRYHTTVSPDDRSDLEITAKLFFLPASPSSVQSQNSYPPVYVQDALTHLTRFLGVSSIDTFILSFYGLTFEGEDDMSDLPANTAKPNSCDDQSMILPAWDQLERLQSTGRVQRLGVSDFSRARLETLIARVKVPPQVDQLSLRDCCVMPKDLIKFAKEREIELLTHGDEADLLPAATFEEILQELGVKTKERVAPRWVVKYSCFLKGRGVVSDKGYIVLAD